MSNEIGYWINTDFRTNNSIWVTIIVPKSKKMDKKGFYAV